MTSKPSVAGTRFGKLVAVEFVDLVKTSRLQRWRFRCDCGATKVIRLSHVKAGLIVSCGCHKAAKVRTHGRSRTPEHAVWAAMIQRCRNPNSPNRHNYGARGITVCERWGDFANFLEDMGLRPAPDMTLDRIDNDKGYSPENCRWVSKKGNARNTRRNRYVIFRGKRITIAEAAEIAGTDPSTMWRRLDNGWPTERAVTQPPGRSGRRLRKTV